MMKALLGIDFNRYMPDGSPELLLGRLGAGSGAGAERDASMSMNGADSLISGAKIRQLVGESVGGFSFWASSDGVQIVHKRPNPTATSAPPPRAKVCRLCCNTVQLVMEAEL